MRYLSLILAIVFAFSTTGLAAAPRIGFVSPSKDQAVGGRNVEISVSYDTRSDKEVAYIVLEIDGERVQERQLEQPRSRGICSFIWNAEEYDNGKYRITTKLYSDSELIGSVFGDYRVANEPRDITPPTIEFVNTRSDQVCRGEIEIQVNAADDSGEPPLVSLAINRTLKLIQNNPPYNYVWDTGLYDDGIYLVEAWAVDSAGNQSVAEALSLRVKNRMEPLQLAQSIAADKTTAVGSTTGLPKAADPPEQADQAITEAPAIPTELRSLIPQTARAPEIGEARGGNFAQSPAVESTGPLVEFIESDHTVPEQEVITAQPEPVVAPVVTAPERTTDIARAPSDLEAPALGEQLATPEYLSPLITLPKAPAGATQIALLPADTCEPAPAKPAEPMLNRQAVKNLSQPLTDLPSGKLRAVMLGDLFVLDVENVRGVLVTPLRQVWAHTGGRLFWYPETEIVKAFSRTADLELKMGSKHALINSIPFFMPIAPYAENGRTMVGLATLEYALQMELEYNRDTDPQVLVSR